MTITVSELINALQDNDPNAEVWIAITDLILGSVNEYYSVSSIASEEDDPEMFEGQVLESLND